MQMKVFPTTKQRRPELLASERKIISCINDEVGSEERKKDADGDTVPSFLVVFSFLPEHFLLFLFFCWTVFVQNLFGHILSEYIFMAPA